MKKLLLSAIFSFCAVAALNAQTNLTEAVDFTVTYTDGEVFNLFEKLDEGKHVVVDFFFTTCGPCIANQPAFTETYQNFGCNDGDIYFLSLESTVGDAATIEYEENIAGENSPPAASGTEGGGQAVNGLYNIAASPTFILINPDRTILEQDMWPLSQGAATFTGYFANHQLEPQECGITSGIEELATAEVSLYPNPAQDKVTISLDAFDTEVNISVFDVTGKEIYTLTSNSNSETIDIQAFAKGTYMVRAQSANKTASQRLVVMK